MFRLMNNILYIGPYREFSGMGNAARQYIKALIQTGHNISIRPIYNIFKPYPSADIDDQILELESNSSKTYHTVIQHCFPHQLNLDRRFDNNIGIIHLESHSLNSTISQYVDIMDKVIVGSSPSAKLLSTLGIDTNKINVIPEPIDLSIIEDYQNSNKKQNKNTFNFYTICDFIDRKNIDKILIAYILCSNHYDDVELVIKTKNFSDIDINLNETIEYFLSKIYDCFKSSYIKKPKIVIGETKYDAILYLHNNNDCYINASSGESFGFSTLEAMAFNNNLIVNDKIGSIDILSDDCGLITKTNSKPCFDPDRIYYLYNNIDNMWFEPDINDLIINMHKAINETDKEKQSRILAQKDKIQNFTIESVSNQLLQIL